ncbi:hypothetical protein HYU16_03335 [Candidatus Woesearchaeota archaeon]|nr:hypothetical protein [Candidatus Woesearchaeota archaeon]
MPPYVGQTYRPKNSSMIGTALFGTNLGNTAPVLQRVAEGPKGSAITQSDAQTLLTAIQHPRIRPVLDSLEAKMSKGEPVASVSPFDSCSPRDQEQFLNALDGALGTDPLNLFTFEAQTSGVYGLIAALVVAAHPDYKLKSGMTFERVAQS